MNERKKAKEKKVRRCCSKRFFFVFRVIKMNPFQDKASTQWPIAQESRRPKNARSLSRIHGMTVGDVRQCFSQMRSTPNLSSNTTLWCGITAGNFALHYLVNTAGAARKRKSALDS